MVSLEFFSDIILPVALWPWVRLSLWQKWVPGVFPGGKGGRCARLTTLPPSCGVMKSGNLNFLEASGPLQACNGTALPFMYIYIYIYIYIYTWNRLLPLLCVILLHFSHDQPNLSSSFSKPHFKISKVFLMYFPQSKFQHRSKLCSECSTCLVSSLNFNSSFLVLVRFYFFSFFANAANLQWPYKEHLTLKKINPHNFLYITIVTEQ